MLSFEAKKVMLVYFVLLSLLGVAFLTATNSNDSSSSSDYSQKPMSHITPPDGHWMNDPNGPLFYNGYYHLFYQYNPAGPVWGNMSWAHVVSTDLVTWTQLPVALYNDMPYDIGGVFSGSAIVVDNVPYLFYTCVDEVDAERQCFAVVNDNDDTSSTTLESWVKADTNPIIPYPASVTPSQFRDPTVFEYDGQYYMLVAASMNNYGVILLFVASTFPNFDYHSVFFNSTAVDAAYSTYMVECPDFFPLDVMNDFTPNTARRFALKYSIMETRKDYYEVGYFHLDLVSNNSYFEPDNTYTFNGNDMQLDYGHNNHFYASKSFFDVPQDRYLYWGWSPEQDANAESRNWQGVQSIPRYVSLDPILPLLRVQPAGDVLDGMVDELLFSYSTADEPMDNNVFTDLPVSGLQLYIQSSATITCMETILNVEGWEFGFQVRRSTDGVHYTTIAFTIQNGSPVLLMNTANSGGTSPVYSTATTLPHSAFDGNSTSATFDMQLLLDNSIIEVFANEGIAASTIRVYPDEKDTNIAAYMYAAEGVNTSACAVSVANMNIYSLKNVWK